MEAFRLTERIAERLATCSPWTHDASPLMEEEREVEGENQNDAETYLSMSLRSSASGSVRPTERVSNQPPEV
jgi:hypothetical protein